MVNAFLFGIVLNSRFLTRRFLRNAVETVNEGILSPGVQDTPFLIAENCTESFLDDIQLCDNATAGIDLTVPNFELSLGMKSIEGFGGLQVTEYVYEVNREDPVVNSTIDMNVTLEVADVVGTWGFKAIYDPRIGPGINNTQEGTLDVGDITATAAATVYVDCERDGIYVDLNSFVLSNVEWFDKEVWIPRLSLRVRLLEPQAEAVLDNVNGAITTVVDLVLGDIIIEALDSALEDLEVSRLTC